MYFLLVYHQSDVQQCTGFSWYRKLQRNDGNEGCDLGLSTKSFKEFKREQETIALPDEKGQALCLPNRL